MIHNNLYIEKMMKKMKKHGVAIFVLTMVLASAPPASTTCTSAES